MPGMLWAAARKVEGVLAVAAFLVLFFNESLGKMLMEWEGVNRLWGLIPILLVFAHRFLAATYEEYSTARAHCDILKADNRDLLQRADDSDRRKRVRTTLGEFLHEASSLYSRLEKREKPDAFDDSDDWYRRLTTFITHEMGTDYLARLNDSSGMTFYASLPQSGEKQEMEYLRRRQEKMHGLQAKRQRLSQFISELSKP